MTSRKLRIESLEARTLLAVTAGFAETAAPLAAPTEAIPWVVNTTKDPAKWSETDAEVSLREAIDRAAEGDVITFDSSLAGGTIVLYGKQLGIAKGITIDAFSVGGMTINGNSKTRVFNISGGTEEAPVELLGLTITGGSGLTGGGIYCSGVLNLTNCNILANAASNRGGGIYEASGTLTLTNCAVTDNSAADVGGGIFENGGILTYTNCTVASNTAETGGGGLYHRAGETNLFNTIIVQNSTDISRNSGSVNGYDCLTTYTAWSNSDGDNLVYESWMTLFADADSCDYSLVKDSVAVNRGNNAYVEGDDFDLAGNPRIVDGVVDLGAYECQETVKRETPSTVVTTELDVVDDTDNLISLREAIFYAEEGDTVTFDSSTFDSSLTPLDGWTITLDSGEILVDKGISIDASDIGGVTIDGNNSSRIFTVTGGTESAPVSFIALNLTGGNADKGGGIYSTAGVVLNLTDCAVYGNTASLRGGGICKNSGSLTLVNCSITDNTATNAGGGIYKDSGTLTLINCTVAENTTTKAGGGIYHYGGETEIYNTIVAQNSTDITQYMKQDEYQGTISGYNSLSSYTEWSSSLNCLTYDSSQPLFADGGYTLAEKSQAIDKGDNSYIAGYGTDLAGNPRIVDNIVDLGAYEYQGGSPAERLAAPTITTGNKGIYVSYGANRHQIQWDAVENASGYKLQYSADGSFWTTVSAEDTSAVITGLIYGADIQYRVRALGDGVSYTDSDWSTVKTFKVCPMDIDGDGDIAGGDRVLMVDAWLSGEGDDEFLYAADINGDGDITGADRAYLSSNWLLNVYDDADDLVYPPAKISDAVFAQFASADLNTDLGVF